MSSTSTVQPVDFLGRLDPVLSPRGPLMVASDATPASDSAIPFAQVLAQHTHAPVSVVSAMRPATLPAFAFDAVPYPVAPTPEMLDAREAMVQAQLARLLPSVPAWPVLVRAGDPIREILAAADATDARVILTGRGKHGLLERMFTGESVMRLLQLGDTPVFAVDRQLTALPRQVLIATDFSVFSIYAAQVALDWLAPDAHVRLVHVAPMLSDNGAVLGAFADEYRQQAQASFRQLVERLARPGMRFETHLLEGNAASKIVDYAAAVRADLVVTAAHGYGFVRRMVLGSVAAELVREAPCSVLCVPGGARTHAAARAATRSTHDRTHVLADATLDDALAAFTLRNAGRSCTVEVDRRDIGAQSLGHHLPLVGITYDLTARIVTVMFGASKLDGAHLSHAIPRVSAVDVVRDPQGRDLILRVQHDDGQTLLMLE